MNTKRSTIALAASLLLASAWVQAAPPLNLKLPPGDVSDAPAASGTTAKPATSTPGVYYGDTSGSMGTTTSAARACDDATFNQAQVHGSVSTGIASGSRMGTSTWNAGNVNISKNLGSCDDPGSSVNLSIGVGTSNTHFRGRGH
jgi:hypothetical protein